MNPFKIVILTFCIGIINIINAQEIKVPQSIPVDHPRLLTHGDEGRTFLEKKLAADARTQKVYEQIVANIQPSLNNVMKDSTWLFSRLQMYWKSHYTDVYIRNGIYQSGSGKAPVPTVRFTGTRDAVSNYSFPKLEDIKPYMDEEGKIYLQNRSVAGQPWEWIDQSKSGRVIESINQQIIEQARDAAFLYWYTADEPSVLTIPEGDRNTSSISFVKEEKTVNVKAMLKVIGNQKVFQFSLPAMLYTKLSIVAK